MDSWINAAISLQCSFTSIHNWDTDQAGRWDKNSVSKTTTFTLRHRAVDHSVPLVRDRKENVFQSPVNTAEPACQNIRNQYVLELVSTSCLHKHLQNCVEVTPKRKLMWSELYILLSSCSFESHFHSFSLWGQVSQHIVQHMLWRKKAVFQCNN